MADQRGKHQAKQRNANSLGQGTPKKSSLGGGCPLPKNKPKENSRICRGGIFVPGRTVIRRIRLRTGYVVRELRRLWIGCTHGSGFWFKGGAVSTRGVQQGTWTRRMGSSVLAGHLADLWLSCLFPNRCQALAKHSQIRRNAVNRKVPSLRNHQ